MRPSNSSLISVVGLVVALPVIAVMAMFSVPPNGSNNLRSGMRTISGWITCCSVGSSEFVLNEIKPAPVIMNSRFGPANIPSAATIHEFGVVVPQSVLKVGAHVSVKVNCAAGSMCTIQEATLIEN